MQKVTLKKGDKISLQSLSAGLAGEANFYPRFLKGKERLTKLFQFNAIPSKHALKGVDFISKNPQKRAQDLMVALQDQTIKGIFAIIGGLDSYKLWPYLDLTLISNNPKFFIGYSDTTAVHLMFYQAGVQSFYGPSVLDNFAENCQMHQYTKNSFEINAFSNEKQIVKSASQWTSEILDWRERQYDNVKRKMFNEDKGFIWENSTSKLTSFLLGGCLETLVQVKTEPFFPTLKQWTNCVMFLETSQEKFDGQKLRNNLKVLQSEINVAKAIIFGKPKDYYHFEQYLSILKDEINKPFVFNLNFGHAAPVMTIPYGGAITLDFVNRKITITK